MEFIISILLILFFLFLLLPKGNNLHEILHIPNFWIRNFTAPKDNLVTHKIKFGNKRKQYFLLHLPKKNQPIKKQVILYFHGGGWMAGTPEILNAAAQVFADQGYISVFSNYRKAPINAYPEMREDISNCLKRLNEYLIQEKFEIDQFIIGGVSAGANLAALLAFDKIELAKTGISSSQIKGVFLSGAPVDISQMKWSFPLYFYAGKRTGMNFKKANPINYLSEKASIPVLLIHGNRDGLVPYRNITPFITKLKSINPNLVRLHFIDKGTHMDTASWSYQDNDIRKAILSWLKEREID